MKKTTINLLIFILVLNILVMVSDYKVLCNEVGGILTFIICMMIISSSNLLIFKKTVLGCCFFFICYFVLTCLIGGDYSNALTSGLYYFIEFAVILIFIYFDNLKLSSQTKKIFKKLITYFFIIWNIFCLIAIYYYIKIPELARLMAADRSAYKNLIIGGGYAMAYGSVVLGPYLFDILLTKKIPNKLKLPTILDILLFAFLIYLTNSFISMAVFAFGILILFIRNALKGKKFIVAFVLLIIIVTVLVVNLESILSYLVTTATNDTLKQRFQEIYNELFYSETSFHLDKRSSLYLISIESFFQHPIFGVGRYYGNSGALARSYGVGSHSTILDTFAQFGLVGGLPFIAIMLYPFKYNKEHHYSSWYLITFLVLLLLNPAFSTYHLILIVYLIIPLISKLIDTKIEGRNCNEYM